MRRNYLSIQITLITFLFATSCEVPVEIEGDPQLVVQSLFSDKQDLIVYVTESNLRSNLPGKNVDNATVSLFSGDSLNFLTTLIYINDAQNQRYQSVDFDPKEGVVYMLSVEVPGHKPVTASTTIPIAVNINEEGSNHESFASTGELGHVDIQFDVSVSINDPAEHKNYYHILFAQEMISKVIGAEGEITYDTSLLNTDENLFIACTSECGFIQQMFDFPSFILNDLEFNGKVIKFNFEGHYSYDPEIYQRGDFRLEMRTVSSDYYQNTLNLLNKIDGGGLYTDYNDAFTNVNNGVGVFAGYTTRVRYFPN